MLIAILSNTYNLINSFGSMEFSLILYSDYRNLKRNDIYGSTFYFPLPICVINILLSPLIYCIPKYSK